MVRSAPGYTPARWAPQRPSRFLERGNKLPASTLAAEDEMHTRTMVLRALVVGILVSALSGCSCMFGERPGGHSCATPMGSLYTQPEHGLAVAGIELHGAPLRS